MLQDAPPLLGLTQAGHLYWGSSLVAIEVGGRAVGREAPGPARQWFPPAHVLHAKYASMRVHSLLLWQASLVRATCGRSDHTWL